MLQGSNIFGRGWVQEASSRVFSSLAEIFLLQKTLRVRTPSLQLRLHSDQFPMAQLEMGQQQSLEGHAGLGQFPHSCTQPCSYSATTSWTALLEPQSSSTAALPLQERSQGGAETIPEGLLNKGHRGESPTPFPSRAAPARQRHPWLPFPRNFTLFHSGFPPWLRAPGTHAGGQGSVLQGLCRSGALVSALQKWLGTVEPSESFLHTTDWIWLPAQGEEGRGKGRRRLRLEQGQAAGAGPTALLPRGDVTQRPLVPAHRA